MATDERIRFRCKACGKAIQATARYCGRRVQCPACQASIEVPEIVQAECLIAPEPDPTPTPTAVIPPPVSNPADPADANAGETRIDSLTHAARPAIVAIGHYVRFALCMGLALFATLYAIQLVASGEIKGIHGYDKAAAEAFCITTLAAAALWFCLAQFFRTMPSPEVAFADLGFALQPKANEAGHSAKRASRSIGQRILALPPIVRAAGSVAAIATLAAIGFPAIVPLTATDGRIVVVDFGAAMIEGVLILVSAAFWMAVIAVGYLATKRPET